MLRPNRSPVCVHRVLKASSRFNSNRCPSYRSTFNVFRDSPAKHHPPATPRRLCKFVIGRYLERRWFPSARASHEASAVSFQRFTPLVSDFGTQSRLYSRDRARSLILLDLRTNLYGQASSWLLGIRFNFAAFKEESETMLNRC